MDFLAASLSAATWTALVLDRALADLSATRLLHLVVQVRRLRTEDFCRGWLHCRKRWNRGHGRCHHDVGPARERGPARDDVWLGAMGRSARGPAGGTSRAGRRGARTPRWQLSPARWSGTRAVLCADTVRQGRRSRHSNPPDMAQFDDRPR